MLENFKKIIFEICDELGIKYRVLSKDWIIKLSKDNHHKYIVGTRFPLNSQTTHTILCDKYATYSLLKSVNIPVVEHKIIFNPKTRKGYKSDFDSFSQIYIFLKKQSNRTLVVKSNEGSGGIDVYKSSNFLQTIYNLRKIFSFSNSAIISPFYEIKYEYRVIYLNGICKLIFAKKSADNSWKHNLNQGALVIDEIDINVKEKLINIANRVVNELSIVFASIDIIETNDGDFLVIEVNSSVSLSKYSSFSEEKREIARDIYKNAITFMMNLE